MTNVRLPKITANLALGPIFFICFEVFPSNTYDTVTPIYRFEYQVIIFIIFYYFLLFFIIFYFLFFKY